MVKAENPGCHLANAGTGNDLGAVQYKVVIPVVDAWMKKAAEFAALPVNRPNIAPFGAIAKHAGISQVIRGCKTAMFFADDMIDFAAPKSVLFVNQAILTEVIGAMDNPSSQFSTDVGRAHESDAGGRGPWLNA